MYEMPICECGEEIEFERDEFFDGDSDIILQRAYGHCPKCGKKYMWKDAYVLTNFSDLEEIE
jgi:hypothetical protein